MSVPRTVGEVIAQPVTLELEYLNVSQPLLQTPRGVFHFLRAQHGAGAVSSRKMQATGEQSWLAKLKRVATRDPDACGVEGLLAQLSGSNSQADGILRARQLLEQCESSP